MHNIRLTLIKSVLLFFIISIFSLEFGCASSSPPSHPDFVPYMATGMANFYGHDDGFDGTRMANGKIFHASNPYIAAQQNLPLGTKLKVTDLNNNKVICVRVADRIGATGKTIITLSYGASKSLGLKKARPIKVRIDSITEAEYNKYVSSQDTDDDNK